MSAHERIGKLEALLARVQTRAAEPRTNGGGYAAAPAAAARAPSVAPATYDDGSATSEVISVAPPTPAVQPSDFGGFPTPPPPPPEAELEAAEAYDSRDMDMDVEVSSEVVEVDIDVEEAEAIAAAESGAQPVAYPTSPPEDLEEVSEELPANTQPSVRPPAGAEEVAAAAPLNEIEEPAPSSSRRPIAEEEAQAEGYEEESAPRHTPPPESGKQVAAAPSVHPVTVRKSSVPPPPSLEGHTLIGGWREPGLGPGAATPGTGVRVPAPAVTGQPTPRRPTPAPAAPPPQASGTRLSPEVTRAELPASAAVASFEGAAPVARPETLGDLLDLTLDL